MKPEYRTELLKILWPLQSGKEFFTGGGERVEINRAGEYEGEKDLFTGAEIRISDVVYKGEIAIRRPQETSPDVYANCILVVSPETAPCITRFDGTMLPEVVFDPGPVSSTAYEMLKLNSDKFFCSGYFKQMENHERVGIFTRLLVDRLENKCNGLKEIYNKCEQNWNETMYVGLSRAMGHSRNTEAFTELAWKVRYSVLSRERNSLRNVEALLLGASGLLERYYDDAYIRELKADFEYFSNKYGITPMMPRQWDCSVRAANHPVLRIAQLAAILSTREFLFENMMRCRTVEELYLLLRAEASEYWNTHFVPSRHSRGQSKQVGHMRADILGINLVVPLMFTYGDYTGDENLKNHALELLEKIGCEENSITDGWRSRGVVMESAFDSQAVIHLYKEFCTKGLCWKCTVGKKKIREIYTEARG